jgi:hypothetical protein
MELPKQVWFDTVEVKYHKIILGDNPSVGEGAPITIHWKDHHREVVPVDVFESKDPASCCARNKRSLTSLKDKKSKDRMKIDLQDRAAILLNGGYTLHQIGNATYAAQEIQQERLRSASTMKWTDNINAVFESSGKAFKRVIRLDLKGVKNTNPVTPAA